MRKHRGQNRAMNKLVALPGNTPKLWAIFEEHSECPTTATDLGKGLFVMGCTEHQVTHLLAREEETK